MVSTPPWVVSLGAVQGFKFCIVYSPCVYLICSGEQQARTDYVNPLAFIAYRCFLEYIDSYNDSTKKDKNRLLRGWLGLLKPEGEVNGYKDIYSIIISGLRILLVVLVSGLQGRDIDIGLN